MLSSSEAQQQYVQLLAELSPAWLDAPGSCSGSSGASRAGVGGPVQSRMAGTAEEDIQVMPLLCCRGLCLGPCGFPMWPPAQLVLHDGLQEPDAAPPLLQAARAGDMAVVEQFLQQGTDINQGDSEGATALHWAADRGHLEVLRLLLSHGADVNATDCDGLGPLHYAALAEQQAAAQLLSAAPGVYLDMRSGDGKTVVDVAPASWIFLQSST